MVGFIGVLFHAFCVVVGVYSHVCGLLADFYLWFVIVICLCLLFC